MASFTDGQREMMSDSDPYTDARLAMVTQQLASRKITDERVLHAMRTVPRHLFVPVQYRHAAYEDRPLDIGDRQTISQPFMVAAMTQILQLRPMDRVLEIGTGSGYQTAILALLTAHVTTVERIPSLSVSASKNLKILGLENVDARVADGTLGYEPGAPYDAIIVTAAAPSVPNPLKSQLADKGRLVCPVGTRNMQHLVRVYREGKSFRERTGAGCVFVPLIGDQGWGDERD